MHFFIRDFRLINGEGVDLANKLYMQERIEFAAKDITAEKVRGL